MQPTPLNEIADLAESIAEENIENLIVDLDKISIEKSIEIIHSNYGDYFLGELVHDDKEFFLYLNSDLLPDITTPRARFTIAHDYGHYFIDNHRKQLMGGISLANKNDSILATKPFHEIEADHFASNLLMPKGLFAEAAKSFEPGIEAVLGLKKLFNTSIEATAIHYTKLDIVPCLFIRWKQHSSEQYAIRSKSLGEITGIEEWPSVKVNKVYVESLMNEIQGSVPRIEIIEKISPISNWVASIAPRSSRDFMVLEQTFKLGNYGTITFLLYVKTHLSGK